MSHFMIPMLDALFRPFMKWGWLLFKKKTCPFLDKMSLTAMHLVDLSRLKKYTSHFPKSVP